MDCPWSYREFFPQNQVNQTYQDKNGANTVLMNAEGYRQEDDDRTSEYRRSAQNQIKILIEYPYNHLNP